MNLEEREWVHLGGDLWCRASAVIEVRETLPDPQEASDN
jgi:hypothetical protein